MQIKFAIAPQKTKVWVGGRGAGKSSGLALIIRRAVEELPRGKCLFSSTTLEQIMNSTLPPVLSKLEEMGFIENIHYVIGKKPLDWWDQTICHPYSPPKSYDNTMTFFNGFTIVFISTAKPIGKRGGSYDMAIVDEAAFVKATSFRRIIVPMVRDNLYRFDSTLHHSIFLLTSQPTTTDGQYILEFENEHIANPDDVLFLWTSAKDNEVVLGKAWFDRTKATMGLSEYMSEVENIRIRKLPRSFYHTFDRDKHGYNKGYEVRSNELLEASWDFGGNFNCASVWQEHLNTEYCLGSFFTTQNQNKVIGVVEAICNRFADHQFKYIRLWGEPRGKDSNPYADDDLYKIITKAFLARGWVAEDKVIPGTQAKKHKQRHFFFESVFNESEWYLPKIRLQSTAAEDLIKSIEMVPIKGDFQKDKAMETDPSFPPQWAPHLSDTMDNYMDAKHYWKYSDANNVGEHFYDLR
jgi:hypothetical protein